MVIPLSYLSYSTLVYYMCFICVTIKGVNSFILLPVYIMLVIKCDKKNPIQFIPAVLILLLELFDSLTFLDLKYYINYSFFILTFFFLLFENSNKVDYSKCLKYVLYGLLLTITITCIRTLEDPYALMAEGTANYRKAMGTVEGQDITTHFILNANELALYSALLIGLVACGHKRLEVSKYVHIASTIIAIFSGLLTQSRTWLLVSLSVLIIHFLASQFKRKITLLLASTLLIFTTFFFYEEFASNSLNNIIGRFERDNVESAGGRTDLFKIYNDFMLDHPEYQLTGTGAIYYKQVVKAPNSIHNSTQQIYVSYGIIGFLIYIYASLLFLKKYRYTKARVDDYLPLFATFAFSQSIQFLMPSNAMLPIVVASFALRRQYAIATINPEPYTS